MPGRCELGGPSNSRDRTPVSSPWAPMNCPRPTAVQSDAGCHRPAERPGGKKSHPRKRQRLLAWRAALENAGVLKKKNRLKVPSANHSSGGGGEEQPSLKAVAVGTGLSEGTVAKEDPATRSPAMPPPANDHPEGTRGSSSVASPPCPCPCPSLSPAKLVALDCEMVGTGPEGRSSEVARCSLVGYYGDVLYDRYIQPLRPVKDYRTRWSGIRQHHLLHAMPFPEAQREILQILKGKIVVGHALHNDFRALGYFHPCHMTRDTSRQPLLKKLANFQAKDGVSLKKLARRLLKRDIQVGRAGHSSVEDATAAMDLYRLVERQWEQEMQDKMLMADTSPVPDIISSPSHYMQDQYWPEDLNEDSK
ncbi:AEN nuclease, partial [Atractosteus spatula]|nr:AEN nuclease [Atractosteus spatula]